MSQRSGARFVDPGADGGLGPWWGPGVGATYVGAVVGAGFATGREVWHFFVRYGPAGWWGLAVAGIGFVVFGRLVARLALQVGASNYRDLLSHLLPQPWRRWMDWVVAAALYGGLAVMLAGLGVVLAVGDWGRAGGTLLGAVLVIAAILGGARAIMAVHLICTCLFVTALLGMLLMEPGAAPGGLPPAPFLNSVGEHMFAPLSGLLYASYNALLAGAVLASVVSRAAEDGGGPSAATRWATAGGVGVAALVAAAAAVLYRDPGAAAGEALPLAAVAARHPVGARLYPVLLAAAMLTTALANAHALSARLGGGNGLQQSRGIWKKRTRQQAGNLGERLAGAGMVAAAVPPSFLGFGALIATVYPLLGWLGLPFVAAVIWRGVRQEVAPGG